MNIGIWGQNKCFSLAINSAPTNFFFFFWKTHLLLVGLIPTSRE